MDKLKKRWRDKKEKTEPKTSAADYVLLLVLGASIVTVTYAGYMYINEDIMTQPQIKPNTLEKPITIQATVTTLAEQYQPTPRKTPQPIPGETTKIPTITPTKLKEPESTQNTLGIEDRTFNVKWHYTQPEETAIYPGMTPRFNQIILDQEIVNGVVTP